MNHRGIPSSHKSTKLTLESLLHVHSAQKHRTHQLISPQILDRRCKQQPHRRLHLDKLTKTETIVKLKLKDEGNCLSFLSLFECFLLFKVFHVLCTAFASGTNNFAISNYKMGDTVSLPT